jgi:hypothetical protein
MGRPYARKFLAKCIGPCDKKFFETTRPIKIGLCPSCIIKVDQLARSTVYRGRDQQVTRKVAHTSMAT